MKVIDQIHVDDSKLECGHFNRCEHTRLELEPGVMQTISVKLPNGQFVTFSFVPASDANEFECCDIHTTSGPRVPRPDKHEPGYLQHLIGFTVGYNTFTTRGDEQMPTTLATLLLNPGHYANGKSQEQAQRLMKRKGGKA